MRRLISRHKIAFASVMMFVTLMWWKSPAIMYRWLAMTVPEPVPAPLVPNQHYLGVVFVGQSNAANHGSARVHVDGPDRAWHEGQSYLLQDPIPGCSGIGGSVGVRLAAMGKPPALDAWLVACVAQGSTSIADWQPPSGLFEDAAREVRELSSRGHGPHWIIIHQGETDAWRNTDSSTYESGLRTLIGSLSELAPNARFLLCQTSVTTEPTEIHPGIRKAQENVWSSLPQVWAGVDTDSLPRGLRSADGVHFNASGLTTFASLLRKAMDVPTDRPQRYGE